MNVPNQKELLALFDQIQRDHPIGHIASRYVDSSLKKYPLPSAEKKPRKSKGSKHKSNKHSKQDDQNDTD